MTKIVEVFAFGQYLYFLDEIRLKRLLILSFGILRSKTVNISLVNDEIPLDQSGRKSSQSQYNYLLGVFQTGNVQGAIRQIFNLLVVLFYSSEKELKILIDRTNWEIGARKVNILSIGLLYRDKTYIPLLNEDLGYKGNSSAQTRINLMDQFLDWWKVLQIPIPQFIIVGDREFIGEKWLKELSCRGVQYVIRLKANLKFETWLNGGYKIGKKFGVKTLHRYLQRYNKQSVEVVLAGQTIAQIYVLENEGKLALKEPFLYLITNIDDLDRTGDIYRQRWRIETCFSHLKSKGLNLESLNLEGQHKTDILMAVLALVYSLIIYQGQEAQIEQPPKTIKYKNGKEYHRVSIFRQGLKELAKIISFEQFLEFIHQLFSEIYYKWLFMKQIHLMNLFRQ